MTLVREAIDELPPEFAHALDHVAVTVSDQGAVQRLNGRLQPLYGLYVGPARFGMIAAVATRLVLLWRTCVYEFLTYVGSQRLGELFREPFGGVALKLVQAMLGKGAIQVRGGAGFGLRLSTAHLPVDHVQGYGLVRGVLEPSVQEALRRHVYPGAVVYDIGANIGFFSLLCARFAGPQGRVESFEPVPASATAVRANATLNEFSTITVHELAVSDHEAREALLVVGEHSQSFLADRGGHPDVRRQIDVSVVALDNEIANGSIPAPDVVKIDVEGSEIAVLRGLNETLRSREVTIICELHETNNELLGLGGELGYSCQNLDGTAPIATAGPIHVLLHRNAEPQS
jgi:FkbM family methyltransferase